MLQQTHYKSDNNKIITLFKLISLYLFLYIKNEIN